MGGSMIDDDWELTSPGLFDFSAGSEFVGKEIVKCIDLAKDGIHAVLVVFSVRTRFSQEEEAALRSLQTLFGKNYSSLLWTVAKGQDIFTPISSVGRNELYFFYAEEVIRHI